MGNLIIKKVIYNGDNYFYKSPDLDSGLVILEGENGSGKTTFASLIYYCLGGNVPQFNKGSNVELIQITNDSNNYAEIKVEINNNEYIIRRLINSNDITVLTNEGNLKIYPIHRSKNEKFIYSDWILNELKIEVIDVVQGNITYKINFTDLMRLIYHDQELNPRSIYKSPDVDNFITDSEFLRKAIFQLLIGKRYSAYYQNYAKLRKTEQDKNRYNSLIKELDSLFDQLDNTTEQLNMVHLNKLKSDLIQQKERYERQKKALKVNRPFNQDANTNIEIVKEEIFQEELKNNSFRKSKNSILNELSDLIRLKDDQIREVTHIKKILYTDEKFNLFSPNTCPYCLREVERESDTCICGNKISEDKYLKYFYSIKEYNDLLKSKQKSIQTIDLAIESCHNEQNLLDKEMANVSENIKILRNKLLALINDLDSKIDINALNDIDDKILDIKEKIFDVDQKIKLEKKKDTLQKEYDSLLEKYNELKNEVAKDEALANQDIGKSIITFNNKYNELMLNALNDCHSARITLDDYLPVIDNGKYREASSSVSVRLMYYFSLLYMALTDDKVPYPNFILADTPETAGIDAENLIKSIQQYDNIVNKDTIGRLHQIILTTGLDKYPIEFKSKVFQTLKKEKKLLVRHEEQAENKSLDS